MNLFSRPFESPTRLTAVWALCLLALAALAMPASAQTQDAVGLPEELDVRAQAIYGELLCPQCRGQTIGNSSAPVAVSMRQTVREMLLEGASNQQVLDFMVDAFGESVLASPPKHGSSLVIWLLPPIALALGAMAVALVLHSLKHAPHPPEALGLTASSPADAAYLSVVDAELGDDTARATGIPEDQHR
ncbi:MAG: cytochrome c-type biogenesis protein [Chloroflexota bacterium]